MSQLVSSSPTRRAGLLGLGLLAALALLLVQQSQPGQGLTSLPLYDFVEYWSAGRLLLEGDNPYDVTRIEQIQRQVGHTDEPIMMWNPPWAMPLVVPLGLFSIRTAHLLWLLGHLLLLVGCADVLWRHYGGSRDSRIVGWLLALGFLPCVMALVAGQISPLLLVGATGFLVSVRTRRDFLAGAAIVLLALKPHLASLFWLALLFWVVQQRRWWIAAGAVVTGLTLTAVALAFDPAILGQYWHTATTTPPAQYRSPTLGTFLRMAVGDGAFRLQFVSLVPGLIWFVPHLLRHRRNWDWDAQLPLLLLVSFLTAPYGAWPFDLVVLLVPVLRLAVQIVRNGPRRLAVGIYVAINTLAGLQLAHGGGAEYLWFFWLTPALLLAYLALGGIPTLRYTNQPQQPTPAVG
jgi:hypothetical protein